MARGYRQARPALHVEADASEGAYAVGVLTAFTKGLRTEAHQNAVVKATHDYFAAAFDNNYMRGIAGTARANFHHVYEYAPAGDPYRNIGKPEHKLWIHHLQKPRGGGSVATWKWRPAVMPVPTYTQRRGSTVGRDDIRNFSEEAFEELLQKSNGRRHVYVWKSVMLEYGIMANIRPIDPQRWLMIPDYGGKKRFAKQHVQGQQAPGPTMGRFTMAWVDYWSGVVPKEWDKTVGRFIERDAKVRVEAALKAGTNKPRKENRTFSLGAVGKGKTTGPAGRRAAFEAAFEAGREQGEAAIRNNVVSMRRISQNAGWSNPLGYVND